MKITILCNDKALPGFESEHGLSVLIEVDDKYYLFDTGSTDVAVKNARKLNIDFSKIETIIISHGHYDHIGGLKEFLMVLKKKIKVYVGQGIFLPKFNEDKYIGAQDSKTEYEDLGAEFHEIREINRLSRNIYILPKVPFNTWERPPEKFNIFEKGQRKRDFFDEELTIIVIKDNTSTVVTGCSHRGIGNIILEASKHWKIENLVGGLHLLDKEKAEIEKIRSMLENLGIKRAFIGHCTGDNAIEIFKQSPKIQAEEIFTGRIFEL